jgi:hypothetical protein
MGLVIILLTFFVFGLNIGIDWGRMGEAEFSSSFWISIGQLIILIGEGRGEDGILGYGPELGFRVGQEVK